MFKEKANPIGNVHFVYELEQKITQYIELWKDNKNKTFWKSKIDFSKITNFLLFALDDFITTISPVAISGPDKKATVLDAIDRLYDFTSKEVLPIWLLPFAGVIKNYIVYVVVSNAIDWIVMKYQSEWRVEKKTNAWDKKYSKCYKNCGFNKYNWY